MPSLNWIGKEKIVNHDKDVPFRLIRKNKKYSLGESENLILEGDNLEALKALMIFNYIDVIIWKKSGEGRYGKMKNVTTFRKDHEYIIVGSKSLETKFNKMWEFPGFVYEYNNPDNDPRGPYKAGSISRREDASDPHHKNYYTVTAPSGRKITRQWDLPVEDFKKFNKEKRLFWGKTGENVPAIKIFLNEKRFVTPYSVFLTKGNTTDAKEALRRIFNLREGVADIFPNPKPVELIKTLAQLTTDRNSIVLDSFAGSGTTAHAVLDLNKEDGGNRKFILVELEKNIAKNITAER